ncbi:MAG: DUF3794 domain-containing protein [Clostridia bacterium]
MINECKNITIKINENKCKKSLNNRAFKQISIPSFITLDDLQNSTQSIASVSISAKVLHSNVLSTPSSFEILNAENTKLSGYKLSIFGIINEVIIYENKDGNMKTFITNIPFSTFIVLSNDIDLSKEVCIDVCIEDADVFYISSENIFQSIYALAYVN